MNKTAIRNFAMWARERMRADVGTRLGLVGINEKEVSAPLSASTADTQYFDIGTDKPVSLTGENIRRRSKLVREINRKLDAGDDYPTVYEELIESVASTWFNRLIAIRFMEINDYFPDGLRVLSSKETGKQVPEIVSNPFESDLGFSASEREKVTDWRLNNKADELFRLLLFKRCHQLHRGLPGLFADETDPTEFLIKFSVIDPDGVIHHLVNDIDEKDFDIHNIDEDGNPTGQVEIIGWMYQYYNTKPKDDVFKLLKKNVKITKDNIPAATQLFTPDWIVRYMVENSLGRLWFEGHPDNDLKQNWKYYLDEAEQEDDVKKQLDQIREEYKKIKPEDIKVIDPCMGSGHILVYAFDVLMQIYRTAGYTERDAAKSILENNLYGLDIDDRAYQLAYFAVMMKAREYNRRILNVGETGVVVCHLYSISESNTVDREQLKYFGADLSALEKTEAIKQISGLLDTFADAREYGSILNVASYDWNLLYRFASKTNEDAQASLFITGIDDTKEQLQKLINVGQVISQKYDVVVTNPPYMGSSGMGAKLSEYVKKNYPDSKSDLFAVFIERCSQMTAKNRYQAMITQHAWMFLSSFEKLRSKLMMMDTINMAHLGARAFEEIGGEVVQTTGFVMRKSRIKGYRGEYCRLIEPTTQKGKEEMFLSGKNRYAAEQDNFSRIPGEPVAYWVSKEIYIDFDHPTLYSISNPCKGIDTGNNDKFLRMWFEIDCEKQLFPSKSSICAKTISGKKWVPYNKGGDYRLWYGNNYYLINWESNGAEIIHYGRSNLRNRKYYFMSGVTWSTITSGRSSFRYFCNGFLFDNGGSCLFTNNDIFYIQGFLNSVVCNCFLALQPTINTQPGNVGNLPIIIDDKKKICIDTNANKCIVLSKNDWDSFETSWDFKHHPLVHGTSVSEAYTTWEQECLDRFNTLKSNEEELNRIFIDIYGLQDELKPEEEDKDVTVRKADLGRDIRSLISYAVGCMFGRYSLDAEGLAFAGGEWDETKYKSFMPDADNVLPITDEAYLPDDIVNNFCEWLKAAYGADTLEENLDFIAKAIGGDGNSSRDVIRNYFINDFFADHCKTYSVTGSGKRPIYWLFDSGKENGFKALVYMHRWNKDTITRVRSLYLHKIQEKYENEVNIIDIMVKAMTDSRMIAMQDKRRVKLQRQIAEVKVYDEKLDHLANDHIVIDLDDGVKANYRKVQTDRNGKTYQVLAPTK